MRVERLNDNQVWTPLNPSTWSVRIQPLKGSEPIIGQRLQGVQPVIISLVACRVTRAIDNSYRCIATDTGQIYDITSVIQSEDRSAIELLATAKAGDVFSD